MVGVSHHSYTVLLRRRRVCLVGGWMGREVKRASSYDGDVFLL